MFCPVRVSEAELYDFLFEIQETLVNFLAMLMYCNWQNGGSLETISLQETEIQNVLFGFLFLLVIMGKVTTLF